MADAGSLRVAAIPYDAETDISGVLRAACAAVWPRRVAGLLQSFGARLPNGKREMWVDDLASGERLRLDAPRGPCASACILDPDALARAACLFRAAIGGQAELILVNRFGMEEANGRGLRAEIAEAICAGHAVLIPLRRSMVPALGIFLGEKPVCLAPSVDAIAAWAGSVTARRVPA